MARWLALLASTATCALAIAGGARAQTAPNGIDQRALSEVVVTAERREESLQRTPIAVSAVSGETLARSGVASTAELTRMAPSLVIAPAAGNVPQVYLRGVGTFVANAFAEQAVAVNLDGVYLSRPAGATGFFYDLQRVEVLKGPQGTLYGRNATGGAVNVIPQAPRLGESGGFLNVEVGNHDLRRADGAVNIAFGDQIAARLSAVVIDRAGYLSDGYLDDVGRGVRGQLLLKPNEAWTVRLSTDYFHQGGKGGAQVLYPFADPSAPWRGPSDPVSIAALQSRLPPFVSSSPLNLLPKHDGFVDSNFWGVHAQADADLGFATLTVLPAYREVNENYLTYIPSAFRVRSNSTQKSLEARLASNSDGRAKWVAGAYLFGEDIDAAQDFNHGIQETVINSLLTDRTSAVFGQATFGLTTVLRATAGARYTHEKKTQDTLTGTRTFSPVLPPLTHAVDAKTWNATTWRVGLEYDLAERSLLYANVGTGFKAGGFFASAGPDTFDPEKLTAYSVGVKNRFWDNRVQLNAEAFRYDYHDQQIAHLGPVRTGAPTFPYAPVFLTENVGRSKIQGAEVELTALATPDDLITADVQYLDAKYLDFSYLYFATTGTPPSVGCSFVNVSASQSPLPLAPSAIYSVNCSGKPANNAPKWTMRLGYEHTFRLGASAKVVAAADTYISSRFFTAFDYLPSQLQPKYTMSNLRLTYSRSDDNWSVTAYVNNVENEAVISTSFQPNQALGNGTNSAAIRPPRTYGVRASLNF